MIVLDASVMVAWLLAEPSVARGTELDIGLRDERALVPSHWPIEISNVLRTHLKAGRLSIADFSSVMLISGYSPADTDMARNTVARRAIRFFMLIG